MVLAPAPKCIVLLQKPDGWVFYPLMFSFLLEEPLLLLSFPAVMLLLASKLFFATSAPPRRVKAITTFEEPGQDRIGWSRSM